MQHIQTLTDDMKKALRSGRMKDFSRSGKQRMALLKEVASRQPRPSGFEILLKRSQELDREWLIYVRERADELKIKIRKTMKNRFSLGRLSNAYVGANSAGNVLYRKG